MPGDMDQIQCLFFDVFGTCVDWRTSVIDGLRNAAARALEAQNSSMSDDTEGHWADLAQQWRNSYIQFTRDLAENPDKPYRTVDQHHFDALKGLLVERGLISLSPSDARDGESVAPTSLFSVSELQSLNQVWHRLGPWPDTNAGLAKLNTRFTTSTLTNGNQELVRDLVAHGRMPFAHVLSADMFGSYKPSPRVYLGAVERMGLKPEQCALVAAHLDDLAAAKKCGLRTVYVQRPREERQPDLADDVKPDVWIRDGEGGFEGVARALGMD